MTPLWIDTDMGFDDMLAIMMIARSGRAFFGPGEECGPALFFPRDDTVFRPGPPYCKIADLEGVET